MWVLKKKSSGEYVAKPETREVYTIDIKSMRKYSCYEDAIEDSHPSNNEVPVNILELID